MQLKLAGSIPLGVLSARCYGRTTLTPGQSAFVALSWGDAQVPASLDEALAFAGHHGQLLARLAELGQDP